MMGIIRYCWWYHRSSDPTIVSEKPMMLILLPVLDFIAIFLLLLTRDVKKKLVGDAIRSALVYAMLGVSLFAVLITEGLGAVHAISRIAIVIAWTGALILLALVVWRGRNIHRAFQNLSGWWQALHLEKYEKLFLTGIVIYLGVLFLIAVLSPPNNNDSLQYHMARIIHWIQNGDLGYFTVAYLPQLFNPPAAEILLLNNFLLVGGDQFVNLVQWSFIALSMVVVSMIAKGLGADRIGQWLAALFILTLPAGILEATSTQNDIVGVFWVLTLASLVIRSRQRRTTWLEVAAIGCIAGLAMLVKVAVYPYVAALLIWAVLSKLKVEGVRRLFVQSTIIVTILLFLNLPGWLRSYQAFGNPLGDTDFVSRRTPSVQSPADILISPIQHLALNIGTPFDKLNQALGDSIIGLCKSLGGTNCSTDTPSEWGFRIIGLSNHEDSAGNPFHLLVVITAVIGLFFSGKGIIEKAYLLIFLLTAIAGFLLFSWLVTWGAFWGRLQLPFFALMAPIVGVVTGRWGKRIVIGLAALFLVGGLPWLFMNRTRPVIGMIPEVTLVRSIFVEPRDTLLFANYLELEDQIEHVTMVALSSGCQSIALKIDSRDPEYYFTALLKPWNNDIMIESISDSRALDPYRDIDFQPCAQICSICGFDPNPDGLIFAYKDKAMTLYLSPEYYAAYIEK
jgi:hypothetical protein